MKIFLTSFFVCSMLVSGALAAHAQTNPPGGVTPTDPPGGTTPGTTLINPLKATSLSALVTDIMKLIVRIGAIVVILMLVYVGFMFVTAQGEPAKLTMARQALLWTVVGALILLGAEAISIGIQNTATAIGR